MSTTPHPDANADRLRRLTLALARAARLARRLTARPHPCGCPCGVCLARRPDVAMAAVSAAGGLCGELIATLTDHTTPRAKRVA